MATSSFIFGHNQHTYTMKIVLAASLLASASAFAPQQAAVRTTSALPAMAELDGMLGVGPETGNKVVRTRTRRRRHVHVDKKRMNECVKISHNNVLLDMFSDFVAQFDPVGLAQWAPADFLRKAELSVSSRINTVYCCDCQLYRCNQKGSSNVSSSLFRLDFLAKFSVLCAIYTAWTFCHVGECGMVLPQGGRYLCLR